MPAIYEHDRRKLVQKIHARGFKKAYEIRGAPGAVGAGLRLFGTGSGIVPFGGSGIGEDVLGFISNPVGSLLKLFTGLGVGIEGGSRFGNTSVSLVSDPAAMRKMFGIGIISRNKLFPTVFKGLQTVLEQLPAITQSIASGTNQISEVAPLISRNVSLGGQKLLEDIQKITRKKINFFFIMLMVFFCVCRDSKQWVQQINLIGWK